MINVGSVIDISVSRDFHVLWNNLIHFASTCMYYIRSVVVCCSVFGFILSRLNIYCYDELA